MLSGGGIDWSQLRFGGANGPGFGDLTGLDASDFVDALEKLRDWLGRLGADAGPGRALDIDWPSFNLPELGSVDLPDLSRLLPLATG